MLGSVVGVDMPRGGRCDVRWYTATASETSDDGEGFVATIPAPWEGIGHSGEDGGTGPLEVHARWDDPCDRVEIYRDWSMYDMPLWLI